MLDGVYLQLVEDMIKFSPELTSGEKLDKIAKLLRKRDAERRWPHPYEGAENVEWVNDGKGYNAHSHVRYRNQCTVT